MRTAFDHHGQTVVVTRDEAGWHAQCGSDVPVDGRFLDEVLTQALQGTPKREIDLLLIRLLQWNADGGEDRDDSRDALAGGR